MKKSIFEKLEGRWPAAVLAAVICAAALLCFPRPAAAEVEGSIVYMNDKGQYIVYGQYKKYFSPLEEVEMMNYDRSIGIGFVEMVSDTYVVVRLLWLRPEFFARDATRIRKTFISPLPTVKKEIGYDTPMYFDLEEEMNTEAPRMQIQRVQTTPYGEFSRTSEVITVDPISEPWKKSKIPPYYGYVLDPAGKVMKLGTKPETTGAGSVGEIETKEKSETTSTRRRRATTTSGENTGSKEDLKEKK